MLKKFDQIINNRYSKDSKNSKGNTPTPLFDFITLMKNWKAVVGDMLATNSIPLKINHGTLIIITKHSAISNELNFMSTQIRSNIVKAYPELGSQIQKIYFQNLPQIFEQMKQDELDFEMRKKKEKKLNHPFSPDYLNRLAEAKEFFKDVIGPNQEDPLDPEMEQLLLAIKIKNDRLTQGKP